MAGSSSVLLGWSWTDFSVLGCQLFGQASHIVPFEKFYRIGGAPLETFPNAKYDAPEEVGGDRKCFDSPIRK